ncbi:MAG: hypothetical protein QME42_11735, partial [bacterium]|nr:hypothetical protein [bacterium]
KVRQVSQQKGLADEYLVEIPQTIRVEEPKLEVVLEAKDVIGRGTESVRMTLKNVGNISIVGNWKLEIGNWKFGKGRLV